MLWLNEERCSDISRYKHHICQELEDKVDRQISRRAWSRNRNSVGAFDNSANMEYTEDTPSPQCAVPSKLVMSLLFQYFAVEACVASRGG